MWIDFDCILIVVIIIYFISRGNLTKFDFIFIVVRINYIILCGN